MELLNFLKQIPFPVLLVAVLILLVLCFMASAMIGSASSTILSGFLNVFSSNHFFRFNLGSLSSERSPRFVMSIVLSASISAT